MAKPTGFDFLAESHKEYDIGATFPPQSKELYVIPSKLEANIMTELPEEICMEILERLPVKSLIRFKTVCKPWKYLINSPDFMERHADRSATNHSKLGIVLEKYSEATHECSLFFHELNFNPISLGETTMIEQPITRCKEVKPLSWCRGLLLLGVKCHHTFLLWNPSTRKCKEVRDPTYHCYFNHEAISASALGYDFTFKSHKIVLISKIDRNPNDISVYNLKTNSWTSVEVDKDHEYASFDSSTTVVNGIPHWLVCYSRFQVRKADEIYYEIEYFNYDMNKFVVVPQPCGYDYDSPELFDMEGRLCIGYHTCGKVEIWVMMKYGVKESWSRQMIFGDIIIPWYPICFAKDIGVSLVAEGKYGVRCYVIYNGKERGTELKFLAADSKIRSKNAFAFVESLISLEPERY
ncbi:hypothetical protein COLO4_12376 [Corchorus olitorius]|uniref:F-box domain-containing protein n=1 Tax=Corchorus olitorius TaxID=93759 RepID=A0A1R3K134_9ROSI|nr:hypothetical protein COLO4_12376 [Corchorus olitorius]